MCDGLQIGARGAQGLAHGLGLASFQGESLDLRLNPIGDEGAQFMAALLRRNLAPRRLGLAATGVLNLGGLHLAEALHSNCRLQVANRGFELTRYRLLSSQKWRSMKNILWETFRRPACLVKKQKKKFLLLFGVS